MTFSIETEGDEIVSITSGLNCTVAELKQKLQRMKGVQMDRQRIMFGGEVLQDDQLLSDIGVKENSGLILLPEQTSKESAVKWLSVTKRRYNLRFFVQK